MPNYYDKKVEREVYSKPFYKSVNLKGGMI
jgi:hypothetical protein